MDVVTFAKYPFIQEALAYVKEQGYSIEDIVSRPAYGIVRTRGKKRVLESLGAPVAGDDMSLRPEEELLSYPVARMLVSISGDTYLLRRYAVWESKRAYAFLSSEKDDALLAVGRDFGLPARAEGRELVLYFTDYLRYSAPLRSPDWKLISQKIIGGMVYVQRDQYARLIEEAVREKIQSSVSPVPAPLAAPLKPYGDEILIELNRLKSKMNISLGGDVSRDAFPPCMKYLLSELQKGVNLPHTARFALTSFLANIGYDKDKIMELYRMAPDFREDLTRYQVEHITGGGGTEYTSPSCKTMTTYGNCFGRDKLCDYVSHPLTYYRKSASRRARLQPPEKKEAPEPVPADK
ncbi:probable DNA primase large subunit [Methanocella paludicola SANAE]|uniref:DNA primase large subunit PriL n=1 Tax=Methanocella paludicola (strain DSM 17711 / JCM 13418 / NBRC 101707 / SANAE) TaxID=304371 RepID=D1Z119_METPS|nr:DNA primase regulatory subunit PriL [Methanocella paludicola]BAI62391.1 probable DNA primase large subunit [Methanocella paludicola SANAE]